jgi:hypothetical protein
MRFLTGLTYALLAPAVAVAALPLAADLTPVTILSSECEYEVLVTAAEKDLPKIPTGYVVPHRISLRDDSGNGFTALPNPHSGDTEFRTYAHLQYAFKPRDGKKGPCTLATLQSDVEQGAAPRFERVLPSAFDLKARVFHLHGADLGLKVSEIANFRNPFDDRNGDIEVPVLSRFSTGQSETLGKDARADGQTDLEFSLGVIEWKALGLSRLHEARFTIGPTQNP